MVPLHKQWHMDKILIKHDWNNTNFHFLRQEQRGYGKGYLLELAL
jgi:hypothetical protein